MNHTALKSEILTDPKGYGYATPYALGTPAGDRAVADLLNQTRASEPIDRTVIQAHEVAECLDLTEWDALTASRRQYVQTLLSMGDVNVKGTRVRASLATIFADGGPTRTAFTAIQTRPGSRSEFLFGPGITVSADDVGETRRV